MIMCPWTRVLGWASLVDVATMSDLSPPWTANMRWVVITTAIRRNLGTCGPTVVTQASPLTHGPHQECLLASSLYSPDITHMSQHNVSPPSFSEAGSYADGRKVQRTHRPRDASSKGRINQETHPPRDASSKGRINQGTHHTRGASS
jgi:hypothetical protein